MLTAPAVARAAVCLASPRTALGGPHRCHEKIRYIWLQRLDNVATRLGTLYKLSRMSMPNVPGCDAVCARQMDLPADSRACNAHAPRYAATTSAVTRKYDTSGFNDWTISPLGWVLSSNSHACPCQMDQAVMQCALVRWTCLRIRVHATLMRRGTLPQRPLSREITIHLAATTGQSRH